VPQPRLVGTPSDRLPAVLAAGSTDVSTLFVSFSGRHPEGRDEEYLIWHSLDHRPEQHRLAGLRQSLRLVSTPDCRSRRAANESPYDRVDHVMTYFFTSHESLGAFAQLSDALPAERRPLVLPSIEFGLFDLAGKTAAPRAVVGADVLPWRPAVGAYLLVERGAAPPDNLLDVDGVFGVWWFAGCAELTPFPVDSGGLQLSLFFLDDDPVVVGDRITEPLVQRWADDGLVPLLGAPFYGVVPFEWDRYLP
jgi:hypothetical protein